MAQLCTTLGQRPETAFPVCGTSVFVQNSVPTCQNGNLQAPCPGGGYPDRNPFYYRFTCFTTGTLGFIITPNDLGSDYDWQLFDITGKTPASIFTDPSTFVVCNWSGETGVTGASAQGTQANVCGGYGNPLFSSMPTIQQGREYLLMVSHFSDTQSGYKIEFKGGTASITDPKDPALQSVSSACDAMTIRVRLNKPMKCASIAPNGSDFSVSGGAVVVAATGKNCNNSFDTDEVILHLKDPLPPGIYNVVMKKGSDGNTIKDNCEREVPENQQLQVTILPLTPIPLDSIAPVACAPEKLKLVFRRLVQVNTISPDMSEFVLLGSEPIQVTAAKGVNVQNGQSYEIELFLSKPIQTAGNWQVQIQNGTDGNTLLDECGTYILPGSSAFTTADTVSAAFTYNIAYGCSADTVYFQHNGAHNVNEWKWRFPGAGTSTEQNPVRRYTVFGTKEVELIVSNGVCRDTVLRSVVLDNELNAAFTVSTDSVCPGDRVTINNTSFGKISVWQWDFGNGSTATTKNVPDQQYPGPLRTTVHTIQLAVEDQWGCRDTARVNITALQSCYVAVPSAFTPNGDGLNDHLYPLNGFKTSTMQFRVYNRFGQLVFETTDWTKRWDGRLKGVPQPPGTYIWTFQFTDKDSGEKFSQKGTTVLIR